MKSDPVPRMGVVDALTAGLGEASRRPWLILVPAVVDLCLWLVPHLSVDALLSRFVQDWETLLRAVYTPTQFAALSDMMSVFREVMAQAGAELNLAEVVAGGWWAAPSALAVGQVTRMTFVSDLLLAPLGLSFSLPRLTSSPWQAAPVQITKLAAVLLVVVVLWLIGQLVMAFYLRWVAAGWDGRGSDTPVGRNLKVRGTGAAADSRGTATAEGSPGAPGSNGNAGQPGNLNSTTVAGEHLARQEAGQQTVYRWAGLRGLLGLTARLALFSLFLGAVVFVLRLPLAFAFVLLLFSGSSVAVILMLLSAGITLWMLLWFLTSFYFVSETVLLDRQPVWRGMLQSLALVRSNFWAALGMCLIVNLLVWGFRIVWGFLGRTPIGVLVAVLGHAYLATGMLLAIFVFYRELCRRWHEQLAQLSKRAHGRR